MHNAIVWFDARTSSTVDALEQKLPNKNKNHYQSRCGLPLSTYFSGVKLRWLKDNVEKVARAMDDGTCLFGTVDSWLLYHLTGGASGGAHVTDVSNASRTMLMNIQTCTWDTELLNFFELPKSILPEIRSSSEVYGHFCNGPLKVLDILFSFVSAVMINDLYILQKREFHWLVVLVTSKQLLWVNSVSTKDKQKQRTGLAAFYCIILAPITLHQTMVS